MYYIFVRGIQNYILKLLNKYSFFYHFVIFLSFHLVFHFFYICKGLMCLFRRIIYFLPGLDCLWIEIPTSPSIPATSSKETFAFFFEGSKAHYNFSFLFLVVDNIILCFDASYIKCLRFS